MNEHYSDYVKKSVTVSELVFDEIKPEDKDLIRRVRSEHIRSNMALLIICSVAFIISLWGFITSFIVKAGSIFETVGFAILSLGGIIIFGRVIYGLIGIIKGIRKGVVLSSSRMQEEKDNRNKTYQYVFDIYMEDRDEALLSFEVSFEVFESAKLGDGVILVKIGKKVKVLADPDRKEVMDVSRIKSGVDYKVGR